MKTYATILSAVAASALVAAAPVEDDIFNSTLAERQFICSDERVLVGDGSPKQRYLHKQLSQVLTCSQDAGCSVGETETKSYTISADLGGSSEWISGGFGVTETWTTGNAYTCNGNAGDTICIWQSVAHTQYDTHSCLPSTGGCGGTCRDEALISSPNESNRGGGFYCVVGTCRAQGDQYWEEGAAGTA